MNSRPAWLSDAAVTQLFAAFARAGHEVRFVGGCVRDHLLGRPVRDLDAATPATPEEVMALLESAGIRAIPTGITHGTVTAAFNVRSVEITTLREDISCDGRHADVRFSLDWEADAHRRDFTMNALFMDADGTLYDYTGGHADLTAGCVRFIGDAAQRIREDYLRILRFFRFFATHGAPPPDTQALDACAAEAGGLAHLSAERIGMEMLKLLAAPDPAASLRLMERCGVLPYVGISFSAAAPPLFSRAPTDALLRLSLLIESVAQALSVSERWRLSNEQRNRVLHALSAPLPETATDAQAKAYLRQHGPIFFRDAVWHWNARHPEQHARTDALLDLPELWNIPVFPLSGKDLIAHGIAPGEHMGALLRQLETQWEESGYALDKDALLARCVEL